MSYPFDPQEREQQRQQRLQLGREQGARRARVMFSSVKCSEWEPRRHAGDPGGCRNDGSNCLCECHDLTQRAIEDYSITNDAEMNV